eukprot:352309-Chlamydomonas_euryale.AAC.2
MPRRPQLRICGSVGKASIRDVSGRLLGGYALFQHVASVRRDHRCNALQTLAVLLDSHVLSAPLQQPDPCSAVRGLCSFPTARALRLVLPRRRQGGARGAARGRVPAVVPARLHVRLCARLPAVRDGIAVCARLVPIRRRRNHAVRAAAPRAAHGLRHAAVPGGAGDCAGDVCQA